MVAADGPQEYEVAFEALAGAEQQTLQPGTVAYIGTGVQKSACVVARGRQATPSDLRIFGAFDTFESDNPESVQQQAQIAFLGRPPVDHGPYRCRGARAARCRRGGADRGHAGRGPHGAGRAGRAHQEGDFLMAHHASDAKPH